MATKLDKAVKISQKHLLGIQDLSISDVSYILSEAKQFIFETNYVQVNYGR